VTDPEPVDLATVVAEAWSTVETGWVTPKSDPEGRIVADRPRYPARRVICRPARPRTET
jgi:hypothetical protein